MRKLYYMPGACPLAAHVALEWIGEPYELERLAFEDLQSPAYLAVNPKGVVPALREDDRILVELAAILFHLVDNYPEAKIGPALGDPKRYDMYQWVSFFTGTLHPHFWPFFAPGRYIPDESRHNDVRAHIQSQISNDFALIDRHLADNRFLLGDEKSVADPCLFTMARWSGRLAKPASEYANIARFMGEMADDSGVKAAMKAQGLS